MENVGTCRHDAKGRPQGKTHKDQVPMRGTGADQPVGAWKPGNAGGAKGWNGSADGRDQPVRGGIPAGGAVVRSGGHDGQESTSNGRNRCLTRSLTRSPATGSEEPDESRGSRPDPRGPGGETPPGHSTQHLRADAACGGTGAGKRDALSDGTSPAEGQHIEK